MRSIMILLTVLVVFELIRTISAKHSSRDEFFPIGESKMQTDQIDTAAVSANDRGKLATRYETIAEKDRSPKEEPRRTADTCSARINRAIQKYNSKFDPIFRKYSKQIFGPEFDWLWFKAQGICESGLREKVQSQSKASGIMQILPSTYADILRKHGWLSEDIFDPESNIAAGILYDHHIWKILHRNREILQLGLHDRLKLMFAGYNAGYGNILQAMQLCGCNNWSGVLAIAPRVKTWRNWRDTRIYIENVFSVYQELQNFNSS
ncbi:MAG: transglycosylase SLT domain-containing protein [candidate division KSB1 bacterium]|nr:transglycosylase SLT domain-containing protein [candidate division KSB1 bacterium]